MCPVHERVPRSWTGEAEALQSELPIGGKAWEKAEAGFTLANAVRVAGPDRILFCRQSSPATPGPGLPAWQTFRSIPEQSCIERRLDFRLLFAVW